MLWLFYRQRQKEQNYRLLAKAGRQAEGEIVKRMTRPLPKSRKRFVLAYRFVTADGESLEQETPVGRAQYDKAREGQPITVLYLPENPRLNRPRDFLVDSGYLD